MFLRAIFAQRLRALISSLIVGSSMLSFAQELISDSSDDWPPNLSKPHERGVWKDGCIIHGDENERFVPFVDVFDYYGHIGGEYRFCARDKNLYPRVGRFVMAPHSTDQAVKQWISNVDGPITLVVDAQRLQDEGDGVRLVVKKNQRKHFGRRITSEDPYFTKLIRLDVEKGDKIQLILYARDNHRGDWTSVNAKIYNGHILGYPEHAAYLTFDKENDSPVGWGRDEQNAFMRISDESGRDHHAFRMRSETPAIFHQGVRGGAISFDGYRTCLTLPAKDLGHEAEELTISFWMAPSHYKNVDCPTILSSTGEDFVAVTMPKKERGNPLNFRIQPKNWKSSKGDILPFIVAPDHSTDYAKWTHVTLVWKSGETQQIWYNGKLVASHAVPVKAKLNIEDWIIGKDHRPKREHQIYNGLLDEFYVAPKVLEGWQIRQRYQQSLRGANLSVIEGNAGGVIRERWTGIKVRSLNQLKQSSKFYAGAPKKELLATANTDTYGATYGAERMRGSIVAPETGYYRFWVASQGEVELLFSTNDSKFYKQSIASITRDRGQIKGASPFTSRPFDFYDSQVSEAIYLEEGQRYFMEALQVSSQHRDNRIALAWKTPSGDREMIPVKSIAPYYFESEENDGDDDSLPDDWERQYGLDASDNGVIDYNLQGEYGDFDADGLNNRYEFLLGLDPTNPDSDGDGYTDGEEYHSLGSDPAVKDRPQGKLIADLDLESYSSSTHDWVKIQDRLVSSHFRGGLAWDFSVDTAGPYFYEVSMNLDGLRTSRVEVPLTIQLDGKVIASDDVIFSGNAKRTWRVYGPSISAGAHQLSFSSENDRIKRSLGLLSVQVFQPEGVDRNADGLPDWYAAQLYKGSLITGPKPGSRVSPLFLEGTITQNGETVLINGQPAQQFGETQWYGNVALQPGVNETQVVFPDGQQITHSTRWWVTNVLKDQKFRIRLGDSIRIGGKTEDNQALPAYVSIDGGGEEFIPAGNPRIVTFDTAGEHTITGRGENGESASLTINVLTYNLPEELAVLTEWERKIDLPILPIGVTLEGSSELLVQTSRRPNQEISKTSLLAGKGGSRSLVARLGQGGPIIDQTHIPAIIVSNALVQNASYTFRSGAPEGYVRIHAPFVALHMPEGARIELGLFRAGMMFSDGSIEKNLFAEDFVDGVTYVDFLFPERLTGGYCHHLSVFDGQGVLLNQR